MSGTSPDSVQYPNQDYGILGPLPAYVVNLQDFAGADPNGNDDSTAAIQAALASLPDNGGQLIVPPGVYRFSAPLPAKANTVISGSGTFKASPIELWPGSPFFGIVNVNNTNSTITDENISVRGITIDYSDLPSADGTRHTIYIRKSRRVVVSGVTILGGSSAIALLGNDDTLVQGNRLVGFSNCGADHWDGPSNGKVIGNYIESAPIGQMVNWNPDPTVAPSTGFTAQNFTMTGNTLVSTATESTAILIMPLREDATVRNCTVSGNTLTNCYFVLRGDVSDVVISGNVMDGFTSFPSAITGYLSNGASPGVIKIIGNIIRNPTTSIGSVGVIRMETDDADIAFNTISGTGYASAAISGGVFNPQTFGNIAEGVAIPGQLKNGFRMPGGTASQYYIGWTDGSGTTPRMYQQTSDNNWIFQGTNSTGAARVGLSWIQRSDTSDLTANVPMLFSSPYRHAVATVAAAGTVIGTAKVLTANTSNVTTCTVGVADGVALAASNGRPQTVINSSAATLKVYPNNSGSSQIDNGGASVPTTIAAGKSKTFEQVASGDFRTTSAT